MKIEKINQILKDPNMQDKDCNFKLTKTKSQSKLDYIIEKLESHDLEFKKINSRLDRVEQRLTNVEQRLDRVILLNNLKS